MIIEVRVLKCRILKGGNGSVVDDYCSALQDRGPYHFKRSSGVYMWWTIRLWMGYFLISRYNYLIPKSGAQDVRLTGEPDMVEDKGIHITSDKPIVA